MTELLKEIISCTDSERVFENEPMKKHTTFRIGGNADIFVSVKSEEEFVNVSRLCEKYHTPMYVIGNGSNLLVKDKGIRGIVVQLYKDFSDIEVTGCTLKVQSGALMSTLGNIALKNSLTGFEFASGIPGTIGGGICMNAGAYGGELKDVVTKVKVFDRGEIKILNNNMCGFSYRTSNIQKHGIIVLEAEINLEKGDPLKIKEKMDELRLKRTEKQPLEYPSAGSTFKRPEGYFAAKLIDDSGLRGYAIGDAQVSTKHCGFVINKGNATAAQVIELMEHIKTVVMDKFGVELEKEVRIIGE